MKNTRFISRYGLSLMLLFAGCTGVQPTPGPPPIDPAPYLAKARAAEERGDIEKAVAYLRLSDAIRPGDQQIAAQRSRLETGVKNKANLHYERGQADYRKNKYRAAQREFMAALRYEPNHAGALDYLKNRLSPPSATRYQVAKGDSLRNIATKLYQDPDKAFLIAYFNDLRPGAEPQPGTTLLIPLIKGMAPAVVKKAKVAEGTASKQKSEKPPPPGEEKTQDMPETEEHVLTGYGSRDEGILDGSDLDDMPLTIYEKKESETPQELIQAKALMGKRDYDRVIPLSRLILETDPGNEEAIDLINAAFYQKGLELNRQRKYVESLEMYEEVEPGYQDVDMRIVQVQAIMKKQAEQYYRQGVNYYVNENLAGAIDSWEKTLALDPDHGKAGQDIEKARLLLKKLQAIQ